MKQRVLLLCGLAASLIYVGTDIIAAMSWEGYSYLDQTVSELRALGAPTRPFLVPFLIIYSLLEIAFGAGVRGAAGRTRALRIMGTLLIGLGVLDLVAILFPMHLRGAGATLTDTIHKALTAVTVIMFLAVIGLGAAAGGTWFRFYSIGTIVLLVVFGVLTGTKASLIEANLPTPWIGVTERINIYSYMLWMAALAIVLLRSRDARAEGQAGLKAPAGRPMGQGRQRITQ